MQAIVTKYLGATDRLPSRVKATAQVGSVTVNWDYAKDIDGNHYAAALALAHKFGWLHDYDMHGGALPDGTGNAYVIVASVRS